MRIPCRLTMRSLAKNLSFILVVAVYLILQVCKKLYFDLPHIIFRWVKFFIQTQKWTFIICCIIQKIDKRPNLVCNQNFTFFFSLYRILSQKFSEERTWSSGHFPFGRTFPNRGNSKRPVYFAQLWTWVCILENAPFRVINAIEFVYLLSWLRWIPLAIYFYQNCVRELSILWPSLIIEYTHGKIVFTWKKMFLECFLPKKKTLFWEHLGFASALQMSGRA